MTKELANVQDIKEKLGDNIGEEVIVTVKLGRNRKKIRRGILTEVYHSVFVVDLDQDRHDFERVSYGYRDILTEEIEFEFVKDMDEETARAKEADSVDAED